MRSATSQVDSHVHALAAKLTDSAAQLSTQSAALSQLATRQESGERKLREELAHAVERLQNMRTTMLPSRGDDASTAASTEVCMVVSPEY